MVSSISVKSLSDIWSMVADPEITPVLPFSG
jgi:hypothetical protein